MHTVEIIIWSEQGSKTRNQRKITPDNVKVPSEFEKVWEMKLLVYSKEWSTERESSEWFEKEN